MSETLAEDDGLSKRIEKLSLDAKKKLIWEYYSADPHRFFKDIYYTLDEYEVIGNPVKKFPYDWKYLQNVISEIHDPLNKWLYFWKSRQVMFTHTGLGYCLWLALFREGRKIAIQSKKADDANALIERMQVAYNQLPWWKPEAQFSYCRIKIPGMKSDVYGIPQGGDQLRQFSFSLILSDEFGFQTDLNDTFTASKPIVNAGGKFVAATTPPKERNFAYDCFKNPLFKKVQLHYSMRPDRGEAWVTEAKKGASKEDWDRENELQFIQPGNKRVMGDFNQVLSVNPNLVYNPLLPLLRGWDFGYHRPAVVYAQIDNDDRFNVLDAILGRDELIDNFAERIIAYTNINFPNCVVNDYCDMAGTQVSDKSEKTSVKILQDRGIRPLYKKVLNDEDIFNMIRRKMKVLIGDKPAFQIHPKCVTLVDAFTFGLLYKMDGKTVVADGVDEGGEKEKGYYMHLVDALKYIFYNIFTTTGGLVNSQQKLSALKNPLPRRELHGRAG